MRRRGLIAVRAATPLTGKQTRPSLGISLGITHAFLLLQTYNSPLNNLASGLAYLEAD